ncbi:MAG: sugar ABC transporter substrate-binding protein [Candidatus Enteromonas sp.]|nr:sugar ABC transporter substrate-binding protein [Candidatus Enteromonas sp.]MDY4936169.1 sugar ABC transporter substrate-binding protein [Candidatus Enteromonas sp.]
MKKSALLLTLLSTLLVTSCGDIGSEGGDNPSGSENTKLKIRFHVDGKSSEGIAYKKLVDSFNSEYAKENIKVTASFVARTAGDSAYERQLATDVLEGTLPDIITFDAPNCAAYADAGYLYDFSSELSKEEKDQYITLNTYNGKTFGIPIQESSAGFYYNKSLFASAGIDVSSISVDNPWTYEQFKQACAKLASINVTPVDMRMDATKDETATYLLYPFIYASGGSFVDETGLKANGYFNSAASKKGFQFLKDLVTSKYTNYGIGATDFFTGKVGMYLSSGWTIPDLDNKYPATFPNRDSWGLLPYPKDVIAASANGSWSFAIGNNTRKNKAPVVKLLKYLTNATSSKTITDATGMIPANKNAATNYAPSSPEDVLHQQLQKTGKSRPVTIGYPQFSSAFGQVISGLREGDLSTLVDNKAGVLQTNLDKLHK